jgi:hypothetical protein
MGPAEKWKRRRERILEERRKNMEAILKCYMGITYEGTMYGFFISLWDDSGEEHPPIKDVSVADIEQQYYGGKVMFGPGLNWSHAKSAPQQPQRQQHPQPQPRHLVLPARTSSRVFFQTHNRPMQRSSHHLQPDWTGSKGFEDMMNETLGSARASSPPESRARIAAKQLQSTYAGMLTSRRANGSGSHSVLGSATHFQSASPLPKYKELVTLAGKPVPPVPPARTQAAASEPLLSPPRTPLRTYTSQDGPRVSFAPNSFPSPQTPT